MELYHEALIQYPGYVDWHPISAFQLPPDVIEASDANTMMQLIPQCLTIARQAADGSTPVEYWWPDTMAWKSSPPGEC